jgi:hypothetical protein
VRRHLLWGGASAPRSQAPDPRGGAPALNAMHPPSALRRGRGAEHRQACLGIGAEKYEPAGYERVIRFDPTRMTLSFPTCRRASDFMKKVGWGARIRTWEWRNQNPASVFVI